MCLKVWSTPQEMMSVSMDGNRLLILLLTYASNVPFIFAYTKPGVVEPHCFHH
jgi:hypothetical protein